MFRTPINPIKTCFDFREMSSECVQRWFYDDGPAGGGRLLSDFGTIILLPKELLGRTINYQLLLNLNMIEDDTLLWATDVASCNIVADVAKQLGAVGPAKGQVSTIPVNSPGSCTSCVIDVGGVLGHLYVVCPNDPTEFVE